MLSVDLSTLGAHLETTNACYWNLILYSEMHFFSIMFKVIEKKIQVKQFIEQNVLMQQTTFTGS